VTGGKSGSVLSSAALGWEGLLLEGHDSRTPRPVEAPEHFSTKHLLRLNTGSRAQTIGVLTDAASAPVTRQELYRFFVQFPRVCVPSEPKQLSGT